MKEVVMSGRARRMVVVDTTEAREETVQVQNMNHEQMIQRTTSENGLFFEGMSNQIEGDETLSEDVLRTSGSCILAFEGRRDETSESGASHN